jgi:cytidylate kinase
MAFIAISGEPGCRHEDLARMAATRFECELIGEQDLEKAIGLQFGEGKNIPATAWGAMAASVVLSSAISRPARHVIVCYPGAEMLARDLPRVFRLHLVAPKRIRLANLMAERQIGRAEAKAVLGKRATEESADRKRRFRQRHAAATVFDCVVNEEAMGPAEILDILAATLQARRLMDSDAAWAEALATAQYGLRIRLAGFRLACEGCGERRQFGHPTEEVFANLLDFHRIAWDYEPRSFPLQWDKEGKVSEAFTPDFYLPEFDLYVELTTMKQANVTRKNRKIRLLRAIYPHVNIQVFYRRDVWGLVENQRLPECLVR